MKQRYFNNFILLNDKQILTGDITITEKLLINNGSLIVYGNLTIDGDIEILNGNIIVYGTLLIVPSTIFNVNGNISSQSLNMFNYFSDLEVTGDIFANYCNINISCLTCNNFNIFGDSHVHHINCLNYLVDGNNDSLEITAEEDIYILGSNFSSDLIGRDIFINGNSNLYHHTITAARAFERGGMLENCSSLYVGI